MGFLLVDLHSLQLEFMELNDYNAILQQLASTPGIQERLRKQMGINAALAPISRNTESPLKPYSMRTDAKHLPIVEMMANQSYNQIQALPYQVGFGPGQEDWDSPNYKGIPKDDPNVKAALWRYLKELYGPSFELPKAPLPQ